MRTFALLLVLAALALVAVPVASAEDPNDTQYGNTAGKVSNEQPPQAEVKSGTASPQQQQQSGGSLPFTGLDLGVALAFGLAAVGGGVALRRAGRKAQD